MSSIGNAIGGFLDGWRGAARKPRRKCIKEDKSLRANLDESQVDKMIDDSFPASDPPSTY